MAVWVVIGIWLATLAVVTWRACLMPPSTSMPEPASASTEVPTSAPGEARPYTLVRVVGGPEPYLQQNLLSVRDVAGRKPDYVIFVVPANDTQYACTQAVADQLAASGIKARVVPTAVCAPNHKVAQLAASYALWPKDHDVICADGDVDLSRYPLDNLREPLSLPGVAAVWAPCFEINPPGASRASAAVLSTSLHCFALLGRLDPGGMVGKLWGAAPGAVERAGGWHTLVDTLGEDMELARRFRQAGLRVLVAPVAAMTRPTARGFFAAVARYARWFWVIRAQRPQLLATYPLLFFGSSQVMLLCLWQAPRWPVAAAIAALTAFLLRVRLGARARRAVGAPGGSLVRDCGLAEITIMAAFACMLLQRTVHWRHQRLQVGRGGRIVWARET